MTNDSPSIFASSKISAHQERIDAYLEGKNIHPITVELDLTQCCTRNCDSCPYSVARAQGQTLQLPFLEKLFSILGPNTPGLVLSGGEATLVPHFPETVKLARAKGFKEIAVISNGTRLDVPEVRNALMEFVTSIRVSMYDWHESDSEDFIASLRRIERLRKSIDREGSSLEIGVAMLTRTEWVPRLKPVGLQVLQAGVDWLYFHPFCIDWETDRPVQADQRGVLDAIEDLKQAVPAGSNIQVPAERYSLKPLYFEALHGSHFLIQIGADGINYAGPECKYHPEYALLNLNEYLEPDFLWQEKRINRLREINSSNYRVIGTKHRPPVFSDFIERLIQVKKGHVENLPVDIHTKFLYPDIV
jgi:hypothetical protein